jgi:hypothetical protein
MAATTTTRPPPSAWSPDGRTIAFRVSWLELVQDGLDANPLYSGRGLVIRVDVSTGVTGSVDTDGGVGSVTFAT